MVFLEKIQLWGPASLVLGEFTACISSFPFWKSSFFIAKSLRKYVQKLNIFVCGANKQKVKSSDYKYIKMRAEGAIFLEIKIVLCLDRESVFSLSDRV